MLELNRRVGEKILIGNDVQVVVKRFVGDAVELGVVAPKHVCIDREEVRQRRLNNIARFTPDAKIEND